MSASKPDALLRPIRSTKRARVWRDELGEVLSSRPLGAGQTGVLPLPTRSTGRGRQASAAGPPVGEPGEVAGGPGKPARGASDAEGCSSTAEC